MLITLLGVVVGINGPIDSPIVASAARDFKVSVVVESLVVGNFLIGFGFGALVAGPVSEVLGRSLTYAVSMGSMCVWLMASALAPNIGTQLLFRFLAGFSGASPLVCSGGSISDMWTPLQKTYIFPIYAIPGFFAPAVGPVMSGWIPDSTILHTWRWSEWVALMTSGLVWILLLLLQPETYSQVGRPFSRHVIEARADADVSQTILSWKAAHLRRLTEEDKYYPLHEVERIPIGRRLRTALLRPFEMACHEFVVQLCALYMTVIFIVLFTFFGGYDVIFQQTYGLSTGITNTLFLGIGVGVLTASFTVPFVYRKTRVAIRKAEESGEPMEPEVRLWYGMLGAPAIPVSLFWMAWTCYPSVSLWIPLSASLLFGYGIICIFITVSLYLIESYEAYAASGLTFNTLIRYVAAGGMTVVGVPFYDNVGPHWTLAILALISLAMAPLPFLCFKYGPVVRKKSRYAASKSQKESRETEK
jgi:MFS family permease